MKKASLVLIIIASILTIAGGVFLFLGIKDNSFGGREDPTLEEKEYILSESFTDIDIDSTSGDIIFYVSEGEENKVICNESEKQYYTVSVSQGKLSITFDDDRTLTERLKFNSGNLYIHLYLSNTFYNNLDLKLTTGDLDVPSGFSFKVVNIQTTTSDVSFKGECTEKMTIKGTTGEIVLDSINTKELSLHSTTGDVTLSNINVEKDIVVDLTSGKTTYTNVRCVNLTHTSTSGETTMTNVVLTGELYMHQTSGDIKLNGVDAKEITIELTTGDVSGTILTPKKFIVHVTTGEQDVPPTDGNLCTITVTTGDVSIRINN